MSVLLLVVVLVVFAIYDKVLGLSTMTGGIPLSCARASSRKGKRRAGDAVLTVLANVSDALGAVRSGHGVGHRAVCAVVDGADDSVS